MVVTNEIPVGAVDSMDDRFAAGVLVHVQGALYFVSADKVRAIVPGPVTTRVAGSSVGIALFGGRVAVVLPLGEPTSTALLCDVDGDPMIVTGVVVVAAGYYERSGEGVVHEGRVVPILDLVDRYRQVEQSVLSPSDPRSSRSNS